MVAATLKLRPASPVLTGHLLLPLHEELVALLSELPAEAWLRRTSAGPWRVRDVAAHLLDGDLRRLSQLRDSHAPSPHRQISGYGDLLEFLNELNATWVRAAERISPRLLVELIDSVGRQSAAALAALDPEGEAPFPVAWAAEAATTRAWLDVGREYSERWHHQDQIREAVGVRPLFAPLWLAPLIAVALRALPRAYARVEAPVGTCVVLRIDGDAGGTWTLVRSDHEGWSLMEGAGSDPTCTIVVGDAAAGRLLMHRLTPSQAATAIRFVGDERLGRPFLSARAVMV
jgi:hypothetical protein